MLWNNTQVTNDHALSLQCLPDAHESPDVTALRMRAEAAGEEPWDDWYKSERYTIVLQAILQCKKRAKQQQISDKLLAIATMTKDRTLKTGQETAKMLVKIRRGWRTIEEWYKEWYVYGHI